MLLTLLIACFNEKHTILEAIEEAKQLKLNKEIIIIDNCSTDGTREILQNIKDDSLRIILQPKNFGPGESAKLAFRLGKGDYFFSPCADLEYKMSDVYSMIEKIEDERLDAVFGSRLLGRQAISKPALIKERPFWMGTIIATFLINAFYGLRFTDIIAPKLIRMDILKDMSFENNNQAFEFELVSRLCKRDLRIKEVPVSYRPRTEGKKIKVIDIVPAVAAMLKVRLFS